MAITIKHAKTDTISDWTQADLDAQIALGNFPAGTVLADIVLPSDWNNDHTISGTVPIANGGTGQTTATAAINALLPSQSSQSGKVLSTDGTNTSWIAAGGTGTVTSVTGTAPVSVATGTTTPVISMAAATGSVNGYLTSTDWNTFNSKAPATSGTSILYGNGSGGFSNVTIGTNLTFSGGTLNATAGGTGDVVGPASATDNAITRFDTTTGKLIQNSVGILDDSGNLSGINSITDPDYVTFNTSYGTALTVGQLGWDANYNNLSIGMIGGNITQHIGEDQYLYIKASATITKGQVIMITGSVGASGILTGAPATGITDGTYIIGVAAEAIANNAFGFVQTFGVLTSVNTSAFADGDILWYNPAVTGGLTATKPSAPNVKAQIAACNKGGSAGGGVITVRVNSGSQLGGTDSNVQFGTLASGQTLIYDATAGYWKNSTLTAGTGISISNGAGSITVTNSAPDQTVAITGTSPVSVTGTYPNFTVSMTQSGTSTNGWLSSTDWNTFNNKQPAGTYVTSVSATSPVTSTGGATPTIAMPAATTSVSGYLTSTDWTTFNNKGSGTVTAVSVVSANGLAGSSSGGATPALTLSTTVTGLLKGNGTAISAATSGTDYSEGTSALSTGILKSTTTTGALTIAVAADFPTLNQNTTGTASNVTGTVAIGNGGTGQTTAAAAYNALNPMTTVGDIIYEGTGPAAARLGIGSTGQVLTVVGGLPAWATAGGSSFPSGTRMSFQQTSAPTGWTKDTTAALNNSAMRIVTGSVVNGGTVDFTTAFASQTPAGSVSITAVSGSAGATTLTTPQIPSHSHSIGMFYNPAPGTSIDSAGAGGTPNTGNTNTTGGGGSHTHPFSFTSGSGTFTGSAINLAVKYYDFIIATAN